MAPITHHLPKRTFYSSSCPQYSTTCGSHRTAVVVILIAIASLVAFIFLFFYLRKRATVNPGPSRFKPGLVHPHKQQRKKERRDEDAGLELPRYEPRYDAPPPYVYADVLQRPEGAHVHGARGT